MRRFELVLAESVDDCVRALEHHGPDAKLLAGGTDLLPQLKNGVLKPAVVVDLSGVARLRTLTSANGQGGMGANEQGGMGANGQGMRIGAAVTARTLELDPALRARYTSIAEGGALIGSVQIRNLATVGGNLCNAAPSADLAAPLLALEAQAVIAGPRGERRVPLSDFFMGVHRTVLGPDEMLVELLIPAAAAAATPASSTGGTYVRHTPRRELDIAVVGVASQLSLAKGGVCAKARIALAAVAPTPVRATAAERALEGHAVTAERIAQAADLALEAARPISDQRGSADFRRHLVRVLTRRTLTTALARASA